MISFITNIAHQSALPTNSLTHSLNHSPLHFLLTLTLPPAPPLLPTLILFTVFHPPSPPPPSFTLISMRLPSCPFRRTTDNFKCAWWTTPRTRKSPPPLRLYSKHSQWMFSGEGKREYVFVWVCVRERERESERERVTDRQTDRQAGRQAECNSSLLLFPFCLLIYTSSVLPQRSCLISRCYHLISSYITYHAPYVHTILSHNSTKKRIDNATQRFTLPDTSHINTHNAHVPAIFVIQVW